MFALPSPGERNPSRDVREGVYIVLFALSVAAGSHPYYDSAEGRAARQKTGQLK